jgi:menaquinone-dependent protoporphyrinogen oxidase
VKVLVSAASRHGSTVEVAATIGAVLGAAGHEVYILAPHEVTNLDGYEAAVIGSAVYLGRWIEPARDVVARHASALSRIPVWLFSSGPVGDPPRHHDEPQDAAGLAARIGARGHRSFAGLVDRRRLGIAEKAVVAAVRAPEGDFRSWEAIEAWALEIAAALRAESGAT